MNIIKFINIGALALYLAFYLVYFYFMNKTSEKKEFKYWNVFNYSYILLFSTLLSLSPRILMLYTEFLYFLSFVLYTIIFYRDSFKRRIINVFTFYITMYLIRSLTNFILAEIFNNTLAHVDSLSIYYFNLISNILILTISISILFIITKQLFIKILIDDGNALTNSQFAILLFPSIVGFMSLFLFYFSFFNFLIFSSLSTVCVVFILVYLTRIKALHTKEKM